jgi:hypothetical protein
MPREQDLEGGEHRRRVAVVEDGGGEVERGAERVRHTHEGRGALPIGRGGGEREGRVRAQVCEGGGLLERAEEREVGRGDERILCELGGGPELTMKETRKTSTINTRSRCTATHATAQPGEPGARAGRTRK